MGVRKTGDFLEKFTWGLAFALIAFSLLSNFALPTADGKGNSSAIQEQIDNTAAPQENKVPAAPVQTAPAPAPAPAN